MAPSTMLARTTKRQKVAHDALFPARFLPTPVIRQILDFLDMPSLVQAAGCSKAFREEIYGYDHPHLWRVIDFSKCDRPTKGHNGEKEVPLLAPAARITDQQLFALLRNCRAVERCKILKLTGCMRVRGHGLEPLRGSSVLQEIDLRLVRPTTSQNGGEEATTSTGATSSSSTPHYKIDESLVLPILSSMLHPASSSSPLSSPYCSPCINQNDTTKSVGLSLVKFDTVNDTNNYYPRFPTEVGDWLFDFHQALRVRAEQQKTKCGYCKGNILDGKSDECKLWIMGTSYCEICEKHSCGEGKCASIWFCDECFVQCCQPMGPGSQDQCPNHKMVYSCKSCDRLQCEDCFDGFMCANDDCCNEYCGDESKDCLDFLQACDKCQSENEYKFFCPECIEDHVRHCRGGSSGKKDGKEKKAPEVKNKG